MFFLQSSFQSFLFFFIRFLLVSVIFLPFNALAIHAIIKDGEPVPRNYGSVSLGMSLETFLATTPSKKEAVAVGQFDDEHRYELSSPSSASNVLSVICDFYQGVLFRIEINYQPITKGGATIQRNIDEWSGRFGEPRINSFPEVLLVFWDDGATRMILQADESDEVTVYSVTYLDDDLFHLISRARVQRETAGRSTYGETK